MNHQLFAELLESVAQQLPLLIDQADQWQFPGLHYQAAASYIDLLQQWAHSYAKAPAAVPRDTGGAFVPPSYLGQAEQLENSADCAEPDAEVVLRHARHQSTEVVHRDTCLNLLARALAACKERGYQSGATTCTFRMAQVYLDNGLTSSAGRLFARLGGSGADRERDSSTWPMLDRFALERCIACSCHELGEKVPAACSSTRPMPTIVSPEEAGFQGEECDANTAWQRLVTATFEYIGTPPRLPDAVQEELLQAMRNIHQRHGALSDGPQHAVHIVGAVAVLKLQEETAGRYLSIRLKSPASVPLKVKHVQLSSSSGSIRLVPASLDADAGEDYGELEWRANQDLHFTFSWGELGSPLCPVDMSTLTVCLSWVEMPRVTLQIRDVQSGTRKPLLPPYQLPNAGLRSITPVPGTECLKGKLRCELHCPVDPATALLAEHFVVHAALFVKASSCFKPASLSLSGHVQVEGDAGSAFVEQQAGACSLLGKPDTDVGDAQVATLIPLRRVGEEKAQTEPVTVGEEVACVSDGAIRPSGNVVVVTQEMLQEDRSHPRPAAGESMLLVPVLVQCGAANGNEGKVTINLQVHCTDSASSNAMRSATFSVPSVTLHFRAGLQVTFEGKQVLTSAGPRILRKCGIKALTSTPVEVTSVEDGGSKEAKNRWKSGPLGPLAGQSVHVLALPPISAMELAGSSSGALTLHFHRVSQLALFFPWPKAREALAKVTLPGAKASWPMPSDALTLPAANAHESSLKVELQHEATGTVGKPIEVHIRIHAVGVGTQEFKTRIVSTDSNPSEKYFISGATTTQGFLLPAQAAEKQEASAAFCIIPLRPGWVPFPRVQVVVGSQEAAAAPGPIFVFPSSQPVVWRT